MNYVTTFRNHWKKITFATAAFGYGAYKVKSEFEIAAEMRNVCSEVLKMSEKRGPPKKVLVVINPAANDKKAEKTYHKYCEPILHLSGCAVEVFKTNYVGHAKNHIESLKMLPDAIVVAGGDGTSSEVVTGLMRREQAECPILLLPLGNKNETAMRYIEKKPRNKVEFLKLLPRTVMPLLKEQVRLENVIRYDVLGDSEDSDSDEAKPLKPIYGLNRFSWGLLKDVDVMKEKYWYFGGLKHHAAVVLNSFSNKLNFTLTTDLVYTPPCSGCSNCVAVENNQPAVPPTSLLGRFIPTVKPVPPANKNNQLMLVHNENCSKEIPAHIKGSQLTVECSRNDADFYELKTTCIGSLEPGINFIKNVSKITHCDFQPSLTLESRTIKLLPQSSKDSSYSIDGEEYDVRPIKISIVPKALRVLC